MGQGSRSKVEVKFKVKVKGQGQKRQQRGKIGPKIAISTVYEPKPGFSCNAELSLLSPMMGQGSRSKVKVEFKVKVKGQVKFADSETKKARNEHFQRVSHPKHGFSVNTNFS